MVAPNLAEERFAAYLNEHGYAWKHEPDYQAELGLPKRLETRPDFLIARDGQRAVGEVRQLRDDRTPGLPRRVGSRGRAGAPAIVRTAKARPVGEGQAAASAGRRRRPAPNRARQPAR